MIRKNGSEEERKESKGARKEGGRVGRMEGRGGGKKGSERRRK